MKEMDFGIIYPNEQSEDFEGYIKYCGINKSCEFIFREECSDGKSNTIYISDRKSHTEITPEKNVVSQFESLFDGYRYYLIQKPNRLCVYSSDNLVKVVELDEYSKFTPLYICDTLCEIIITFMPARMIIIEKESFLVKCDLNLMLIGAIEPLYVQPIDNRLLITDSSNHTVTLIGRDLSVYWRFGEVNHPGSEGKLLCVPVSAIRYLNYVIISEQRSHRIIVVDYEKSKIIKQLGIANQVGCTNGLLWAPQATLLDSNLFAIMCKGSRICIKKFNSQKELWEPFWGKEPIIKSEVNFPRGCDFSLENNLLAVADTYHGRVLIYDLEGEIVRILDNENLKKDLSWPRCVTWMDGCLVIVNSKNREVLILDTEYRVTKIYTIPETLAAKQWIQSVSIFKNMMLMALETEVLILDLISSKVLWDSSKLLLNLKDVHQATFIQNGDILISDTGNNRVVHICDGKPYFVKSIKYEGKNLNLKKPRMVMQYNSYLYLVNSGTSQIYVCTTDLQKIVSIYGKSRGLNYDRFSIPRWICHGIDDLFFISDTDNHRIALRRVVAESN